VYEESSGALAYLDCWRKRSLVQFTTHGTVSVEFMFQLRLILVCSAISPFRPFESRPYFSIVGIRGCLYSVPATKAHRARHASYCSRPLNRIDHVHELGKTGELNVCQYHRTHHTMSPTKTPTSTLSGSSGTHYSVFFLMIMSRHSD